MIACSRGERRLDAVEDVRPVGVRLHEPHVPVGEKLMLHVRKHVRGGGRGECREGRHAQARAERSDVAVCRG